MVGWLGVEVGPLFSTMYISLYAICAYKDLCIHFDSNVILIQASSKVSPVL